MEGIPQSVEESQKMSERATDMAPIHVERLSKTFEDEGRGSLKAVDDVSFRCEKGEIFGLLGTNGAGKTTTLRMLGTLLRPTGGDARVTGWSVLTDPDKVRQSLGYLSTTTALYPRLSCIETLEFFARINGYPEERIGARVEELIARFELSEFAHARIERLSTGMAQKVAIARTVAHDPEVIILDEPTNGLDVLNVLDFHRLMTELKEAGKAVLFSTHTLSEAERLCDRIAVIHRGRILASGTLEELREQTGQRFLEDIFVHLLQSSGLGKPEDLEIF